MKAISYNATSNSITLQPGIRWGEALTQLESHGVAPLGGRLPYFSPFSNPSTHPNTFAGMSEQVFSLAGD